MGIGLCAVPAKELFLRDEDDVHIEFIPSVKGVTDPPSPQTDGVCALVPSPE